MTDVTMTDTITQHAITRLATINSAISILNLTNGKPAKVTVDEVLDFAERIEREAWRDLLSEQPDARAQEQPAPSKTERPADPALAAPPAKAKPEPATGKKDDRPRPDPNPPRSNGDGQRGGAASTKQINAIFAIGKSKGDNSDDLKAWVTGKFGKSVSALSTREASKLIDDLKAL